MADVYSVWLAAQIAEGETMQDGMLRVARLLEGYDIMGLAEEQRQNPGPFGGPGTPNAMLDGGGK